jgi:hypothetical protein
LPELSQAASTRLAAVANISAGIAAAFLFMAHLLFRSITWLYRQLNKSFEIMRFRNVARIDS